MQDFDADNAYYDPVDNDGHDYLRELNIQYQDDGVAIQTALINRFFARR